MEVGAPRVVIPPLSICVGWRDQPSRSGLSSRGVIWDWLADRYRALIPEAEIVVSDDERYGKFNRAAARNRAVEKASHDLILVVDADVLFHRAQIDQAIDAVIYEDAKWVTPYTLYLKADQFQTKAILAQPPDIDVPLPERDARHWSTLTGTAGLMLVTREAWDTVGGYDETFTGWGWEDFAIVVALETLVHGVVRTEGFALHLDHERLPSAKRIREKSQMEVLYRPYIEHHGDPDALRAVLVERGVLR